MPDDSIKLSKIYDGWEGYQTSLVHAIQPVTQEQLAWRPAANLRSVGDLASHIAFGRIGWFARMQAPGSLELMQKAENVGDESAIAGDKAAILLWMKASWQMIADTLNQWTVQDLWRTYRQEYSGKVYQVSFQWTIWRILIHDVHHGGELALMLGVQGLSVPELGDRGGHLVRPPLAE